MVVQRRIIPPLLSVVIGLLMAGGVSAWRETLNLSGLVRSVARLEGAVAVGETLDGVDRERMRGLMVEVALSTTDHRLVAEALLVAEKNLRKGEVEDSHHYTSLALAAARTELNGLLVRAILVTALAAVLIGMLVVVIRRRNPESLLDAIVDEVSRINSGRVPVAISYYGDIAEDLQLTLRYIETLESRRWRDVRRFADEHAMPAVIEHMNESFLELGPILEDINLYLTRLAHEPESLQP